LCGDGVEARHKGLRPDARGVVGGDDGDWVAGEVCWGGRCAGSDTEAVEHVRCVCFEEWELEAVANLSVTYLRVHALEDVLKGVVVQCAIGESEAADCESLIISRALCCIYRFLLVDSPFTVRCKRIDSLSFTLSNS
jgi:hypothetical protein